MSRQEIKKNYNEAEEKNFDISQEIQEEETRHMDYIYMVNGDKLIIRMNAAGSPSCRRNEAGY